MKDKRGRIKLYRFQVEFGRSVCKMLDIEPSLRPRYGYVSSADKEEFQELVADIEKNYQIDVGRMRNMYSRKGWTRIAKYDDGKHEEYYDHGWHFYKDNWNAKAYFDCDDYQCSVCMTLKRKKEKETERQKRIRNKNDMNEDNNNRNY